MAVSPDFKEVLDVMREVWSRKTPSMKKLTGVDARGGLERDLQKFAKAVGLE